MTEEGGHEDGEEGEGGEGGGEKKWVRSAWSAAEEESIFLGVQQHGEGHWKLLSVPGRSNVDIKDKWRTMVKQGRVKHYEQLHGPLPAPLGGEDRGED